MLVALFIVVICYVPIVDGYIPRTNFGPSIPDIGAGRLTNYLLFLVFIVDFAVTKRGKLLDKWTGILVIFLTIVLLSVSWSNYPYNGLTLQNIFNTVFIPIFLSLVAMNLFRDKHNSILYVRHITIASFLLSLTAIAEMSLKVLAGEESFRATGVFENPNGLAIFLVLAVPCILYAREKHLVSTGLLKVLPWGVVVAILCTVSRKGIITMFLTYILYSQLKNQRRKVFFCLVVASMLAVGLSGFTIISGRFRCDEIQRQVEGKWNMTKAGWMMFKTSPFIGLGYKGYYDNFGKYFPWSTHQNYDAHNIFITALSNYGLVGAIPFMGIFVYPLFSAIRTVRRRQINSVDDDYSKDMAIVCICSVISFAIMGWAAGGLFYSDVIVPLLYSNIALFLSVKD